MKNIAQAGNIGDKVRSDCHIQIEMKDQGGIQLDMHSKVASNYGKQIKSFLEELVVFFELDHAHITLNDYGAVNFVIAARFEAAVKQLKECSKEYLLDIIEENTFSTRKDQFRFSRLYLPGNSPKLMINAGIHNPNGIILDLEDAVAPDKKPEARFLVRNALRSVSFYGAEHMVRINQIPEGLEDLDYIVNHPVHLILVPKCESADQIHHVNKRIQELCPKKVIWLMPIIESALGVVKAFEIASAADNISSVAIGLEDYTADLGTKRTAEGKESFYARSQVVNACRAAGVQPIDSVFSDIADMDALALNVQNSKALGFDGMGCIHPRQIAVVHANFAPSTDQIDRSCKIVFAFEKAKEQGKGVVALGSKMIDAPVVKRAQKTVDLALKLGLINNDWRTLQK